MSELGRFLERFYGPHDTFRTVRAKVRHMTMAAPAERRGRRRPIGRERTDLPAKEEVKELNMWACLPDQGRLEVTQVRDGQFETTLEVINGDKEWKRHASGVVEHGSPRRSRSSDHPALPTEIQRHFHRYLMRQCFAALTLESIETCLVAGRECLKIRAVQVPGIQLWPHWLSWTAQEFEFAADVEHAVLLSIAGMVEGSAVESHEVLEVAFDEDFEPSLFTYQLEPGQIIQPATPIAEHITLEAAAVRVPFTLLRPTFVPEREKLQEEVMYLPARPGSPDEHVKLFYRGGESFDSLGITQRLGLDKKYYERLEWTPFTVNSRQFEVSDPGPDGGLRVFICEHEGTHVDITSDLPTETLIKIALSLSPVPKEFTDR